MINMHRPFPILKVLHLVGIYDFHYRVGTCPAEREFGGLLWWGDSHPDGISLLVGVGTNGGLLRAQTLVDVVQTFLHVAHVGQRVLGRGRRGRGVPSHEVRGEERLPPLYQLIPRKCAPVRAILSARALLYFFL